MMTTAPTRYTIEFMEPPSSPTGSQPSRGGCVALGSSTGEALAVRPRRRVPRCSLEYAKPDSSPRAGGPDALAALESGGWMTCGGPESLRRSRREPHEISEPLDRSDGGIASARTREAEFLDSGLQGGGLEAEQRGGAARAAGAVPTDTRKVELSVATKAARPRLVAAMTRTSTVRVLVLPSRSSCPLSRPRNSLTCNSSGSSAISSRTPGPIYP